ncbi:MAG: fatty acyl-AMP ligase [Deltaproteobacteria bacterium]|jgi:fatty-acyl-CoA synthase|nr:fatty acyl-AMP ligase [Deltaproteobacteria bacterium]
MIEPTPTQHHLALRRGDFANLAEALDYAAGGKTGYNFYNGTGKLAVVLPYRELRKQARSLARRLLGLGARRRARVALVADTHPDFMRYFFACQYAGLVPVPLPAPIQLGIRQDYIGQLQGLLQACRAEIAVAAEPYLPSLMRAAAGLNLSYVGGTRAFGHLPAKDMALYPAGTNELAYLQFTSGSTRFPRGVMISQKTVMNNLSHLIELVTRVRKRDRAASWLPFYHDMGLVGMVLAPMASQISVDYLNPRDFAMRPRLWLKLISRNQATISFGSARGYQLCRQRLRPKDVDELDLRAWRLAAVGSETINPATMKGFAAALAPAGFRETALVAGYGMAECSLAVSFSKPGKGLAVDQVDPELMADQRRAKPLDLANHNRPYTAKEHVSCGQPMPGYEIQVRDERGRQLPERHIGRLYVRGPSVMSGYLNNAKETREVLSADGWLNTGDLAYIADNHIFVTGRQAELIVVNGRSVWPQDLEGIAERQPEVRMGDAAAIAVPGGDGRNKAVLLLQCRKPEQTQKTDLALWIRRLIRRQFQIDCQIVLVSRHTLPRTTSGKLARAKARQEYIIRMARTDKNTNRPTAPHPGIIRS